MKEYVEREALIEKAREVAERYAETHRPFAHGMLEGFAIFAINEIPAADVVEREAWSGIMRESMTDAIKEFASNFDMRLCLRQRWYAEKGETEKAQAFEEVHELLMKAVEEVGANG